MLIYILLESLTSAASIMRSVSFIVYRIYTCALKPDMIRDGFRYDVMMGIDRELTETRYRARGS